MGFVIIKKGEIIKVDELHYLIRFLMELQHVAAGRNSIGSGNGMETSV